jgi:hypothetical protein
MGEAKFSRFYLLKRNLTFVMRGLDPRIHLPERDSSPKMDCRVEPGNDALEYFRLKM